MSEHSITVQLLEYNRIEGMITQAEYSRTNRSKYNQGILKAKKIKKQEICNVLRVDKEKGYIDLSKKQIRGEEKKEIDERFEKGKKVQNLIYPLCEAFKVNMEDLYRKIVWPLQNDKEHAFDALQRAVFNFEEVIGPLNLEPKIKERLEQELKKKFTPQPSKIRAVFEIRSFGKEGVDAIKRALRAGEAESTEEIELKINLIAPPYYVVQTTTMNKQQGIIVVQNCLNKVKEVMIANDGKYEEKEFIKNADDKGGQYEKFYEQNKAESDDDNDEEDNDEGMGDLAVDA